MTPNWFDAFFKPKSVAVVGVSASPEKLGHAVARNLLASGFSGHIHFVSRHAGELFGLKVYASVADLPKPIDLAVLIVPSEAMSGVIEDCGRAGVRAAIISSGGFGETGPEGKRLEDECLAVARRHNMRLMGPNCIGILDTHLPLDTTFLQSKLPAQGGIALVSHSGAICAAIVDWARGQAFGFSRLVSLGNQVDINETDVLEALAPDENTRVIAMYLEGISDGPRFVEIARRVTQLKPVIALKAGRGESGQRAAASHTGAMAGSDVAFDAAFVKAGVLRAESVEQVFDWARALQGCPLPEGKGVAVLTDAGGLGVIAADSLETNGLHLAQLADDTQAALAAVLPSAASTQNPVDLLAAASPETYSRCLEILLADSQVDIGMVILVPPPLYTSEAVADALVPIIQASKKPVVVVLAGSELAAGASQRFSAGKVVFYPFPERAASSLGVLAKRSDALNAVEGVGAEKPAPAPSRAGIRTAPELLEAYAIPHARSRVARTRDEAAAIAAEFGFPVAMKVESKAISHKSDIGGVLLDVKTAADVAAGFDLLTQRAAAARPDAVLDGILIQQQVGRGQELIIGIVRDPTFGPMVMFGSGGTEAEGLRDVAFSLCPLSRREAEALIQRTWAGRKLDGFRNIAAADKVAVRDILMKVARLAQENPDIQEFEINPVVALESGAIAVDWRATFAEDASTPRSETSH